MRKLRMSNPDSAAYLTFETAKGDKLLAKKHKKA